MAEIVVVVVIVIVITTYLKRYPSNASKLFNKKFPAPYVILSKFFLTVISGKCSGASRENESE